MGQVVTIGLDIAKSVFQVHGVDAVGEVVVRRQVRRPQMLQFFAKQPACLVGIEACASAHYWARELSRLGHQVKLMPPSYVKPYVKRQKNDAADAEAICEAVTRPTMRFVEVKSPEQQSVMVLHRVRMMLMRQRIQLSNAIRGHMAEFGLVAPIGREGLQGLINLLEAAEQRVPDGFRAAWQAACAKAGVKGVTFHDLRGTFVTHRLAEGWTPMEVAICTAHSVRDLSMLDVYADRSAMAKATAERISRNKRNV